MALFGRNYSSSLYTARLLGRTILQVFVIAVIVEAIYLSERSISILKLVIDEPIGLANVIPLLGWTAPEVHLALPIAVLIAVHRVTLHSREQLEFIALASAGQSTYPFLVSATIVALIALASSVLISGAAFPYSKYAFRSDVEAIRYQSLRAGSTPGQFVNFPNYTIYIFPSDETQVKRPIFVKQIIDNKKYRIVDADRADLIERPERDSLTLRMLNVTVNDFPNENEPWVATEPERKADARDAFCKGCADGFQSLRTVMLLKELDIKNLVHFEPRGTSLDEWTMPELLGLTSPPGGRAVTSETHIEALHRFARSLLCFVAPFLAWFTLTFTTRRSQAFALPVACVVLMCGDIGFSQLISKFPIGSSGFLGVALVVLTLALVVLLIKQVVARQHLVVSPMLARS